MTGKNHNWGEMTETVGDLSPAAGRSLENIRELLAPMRELTVDNELALKAAQEILKGHTSPDAAKDLMALVNQKTKLLTGEPQSAEAPLREEDFDYRGMPEKESQPQLNGTLSEKSLAQYAGSRLEDKIEYLVVEETQTWLDVAFVQMATRANIWQETAIGEAQDVAKMFFGEGARVEKILGLYEKQISRLDLKLVMAAVAGLFVLAYAERLAVVPGSSFLIRAIGTILFYLEFQLMTVIYRNAKRPSTLSRRFVADKYQAMKVPEAATKLVGLAYLIHDLVWKLQEAKDESERIQLTKKLQTLMKEAEELAGRNRRLLQMRAKDSVPKPRIAVTVETVEAGNVTNEIAESENEADAEEAQAAIEKDERARK